LKSLLVGLLRQHRDNVSIEPVRQNALSNTADTFSFFRLINASD